MLFFAIFGLIFPTALRLTTFTLASTTAFYGLRHLRPLLPCIDYHKIIAQHAPILGQMLCFTIYILRTRDLRPHFTTASYGRQKLPSTPQLAIFSITTTALAARISSSLRPMLRFTDSQLTTSTLRPTLAI